MLRWSASMLQLSGAAALRRCVRGVATTANGAVKTSTVGTLGEASFKMEYSDAAGPISPWHDIPAYVDEARGIVNFVNEIPRYTTEKMEVCKEESHNPIIQDIKNGKPRHYHGPLYWNYGCVPQTWEDPTHADPGVPGVLGDNDPLDVVEIGSATIAMGEVVAVKPLGIFSMLDDGELDWKMVVIRTDDPAAAELNDIRDVDDSVISGIREWFRWYKTPDGKPVNRFGHGERALGRAEALEVVAETHAAWKMLYAGESDAPTNKDIWTKSA